MLQQIGESPMRNLNEQELRDEEFQLVDTNQDDQDDGWLVKSVQRVRRELGRLFGNGAAESVASTPTEEVNNGHPTKAGRLIRKRHQNSELNRNKRNHHAGKKRRHSLSSKPEAARKSSRLLGRHKKRNLDMQDEDFEGSGMPDEIDDYETEQCK